MRFFTGLAITLLVFTMISCGGGIKKDLERFIGQEIEIPRDLPVSLNGKDSLQAYSSPKDVKMVVWYDSTGCSSCRLKNLWQWEDYAHYADSAGFDLFIILSPTAANVHSVNLAVRSQKVSFPVYKDYDCSFYELNSQMPSNSALHTFLLDKNDKVVIAGDPLNNPNLDGLYRNVIQSMLEGKQ